METKRTTNSSNNSCTTTKNTTTSKKGDTIKLTGQLDLAIDGKNIKVVNDPAKKITEVPFTFYQLKSTVFYPVIEVYIFDDLTERFYKSIPRNKKDPYTYALGIKAGTSFEDYIPVNAAVTKTDKGEYVSKMTIELRLYDSATYVAYDDRKADDTSYLTKTRYTLELSS